MLMHKHILVLKYKVLFFSSPLDFLTVADGTERIFPRSASHRHTISFSHSPSSSLQLHAYVRTHTHKTICQGYKKTAMFNPVLESEQTGKATHTRSVTTQDLHTGYVTHCRVYV